MKRTHYAEALLKDGRYVSMYFESKAGTWEGLCRSARRALCIQALFEPGETFMEKDIAVLRVDGNAA